jgi:Cu+-exporting ATPase
MTADSEHHACHDRPEPPPAGACCHAAEGHVGRHHPAAAPAQPAAGAVYTCPMHPQVRQVGPGACPICGMALEPAEVALGAEPNPELADMTRRFWIGLAFAAPVFAIEMGGHLLGMRSPLAGQASNWIQLVLSSPVVLWAGAPFFVRGWRSLTARSLNMFSLIALGTGAAYGFSLAATLTPGLLPPAFLGMDGAAPVYFEAAAVITVLVLLGQVLELRAREQTGGAIRTLLDLAPRTARRLGADGAEAEVAIDRIQVGDRLRVRPGETTPVDGVVLEGRSHFDESMVTGESMPVARGPGEALVAGTLNQSGAVIMRADKVGRDTLLARIVAMVAEAQRSRAPIQRLADQVAGWFVPAVLATALAAFIGWALFGPEPRLAYALTAAVSVLIIACPCALGLATPMSIMVGVGRGARAGVLIRSAEALERLETVDTLVVDKTGTLTEGRPAVSALRPAAGWSEADLLTLAASLELPAEHPLAAAIVAAARARGLALSEPAGFDAPTGKGVTGRVGGRRVVVGAARFLRELGVETTALTAEAETLAREGATAVFVGVDGALAGVLGLADPVKPTAQAAVEALQAAGLRIVMLTGDNRITAQAVARRLGLAEIEAEVLPDQKGAVVRRLQAQGRVVAMAGDGVNDAPALAAADVGIAMGAGADVAIESAGVTLVRGDLTGLVRARTLSRAVMGNIRQNLVFAFAYNALGVPIAAGLLYPAFHLMLSPILAAAAMSLSSVSVIGNALRLRGARLD